MGWMYQAGRQDVGRQGVAGRLAAGRHQVIWHNLGGEPRLVGDVPMASG